MELTDILYPWAGTRLGRFHAQGCRVVHGLGNWGLRHLVEIVATWHTTALHAQQHQDSGSSGPLTLVGALVIGIGSTAGVSMLLFKELRQTWRENDQALRETNKLLREDNSRLMKQVIEIEEKNVATVAALTSELVELRGDLLRQNGRQS